MSNDIWREKKKQQARKEEREWGEIYLSVYFSLYISRIPDFFCSGRRVAEKDDTPWLHLMESISGGG